MLIALFTILFLGGGGSSGLMDFISDTKDGIKAVVEDDERRKEALVIVKESKKSLKARQKAFRVLTGRINDLLKSGEFSEHGAGDAWYGFFAINDEYSREMIDARFRLKDVLTREEWEQVFPTE